MASPLPALGISAEHLHKAADVLVGGGRQNGAKGSHIHLLQRHAADVHPVLGEKLAQHPAELVVVELQEAVQAFLIQLHMYTPFPAPECGWRLLREYAAWRRKVRIPLIPRKNLKKLPENDGQIPRFVVYCMVDKHFTQGGRRYESARPLG